MTKEEFEQQYAERSHITVERLHELGRYAEPCDCGDESCQGWQMLHEYLVQAGEPLYTGRDGKITFDGQILTDFDRLPKAYTFKKPDLMKEITLTITVKESSSHGLRLWLFKTLMRLAVWVGSFGGVEFIPMQEPEKPTR